jgi:phage N-6-adenine-methyltransferase
MKGLKTLFSSKKDDWETPMKIFLQLEKEFGPFDLDPCASHQNNKCSNYFTRDDDGLSKSWGGKVFMNPPYGHLIGDWAVKHLKKVVRGLWWYAFSPPEPTHNGSINIALKEKSAF